MSSPNWANQTIWTGDCLDILRGMNSESVDLIYLDPPFNSNSNYASPIGSEAAGAAFKDTWSLSDVDVEWINLIEAKHLALHRVLLAAMTDSDKSYLVYMAARLLEMRRVLNPNGSIYLHCDPTMSHYLKLLMDAMFGKKHFRNEIVWDYSFRLMDLPRFFNRKHDVILFYAKTDRCRFSMPKTQWERDEIIKTRKQKIHLDDKGNEVIWMPGGRGKSKSRLKKLSDIMAEGKAMSDVWPIPIISSSSKERTGYPTQKPLALLDRIIKASSNKGDVVFDPFCGCATTLVSADLSGRKWIGIDISGKAAELVVRRIEEKQGLWREIVHRTDILQRTDLGKLPRYNAPENRRNLYGLQAGNCTGCKAHFEARHLEVDHIIPEPKAERITSTICNCCVGTVTGSRGIEAWTT